MYVQNKYFRQTCSSRTRFFDNFFNVVFLNRVKYSFCKLEKLYFHEIGLVNCKALQKGNMFTKGYQNHDSRAVTKYYIPQIKYLFPQN